MDKARITDCSDEVVWEKLYEESENLLQDYNQNTAIYDVLALFDSPKENCPETLRNWNVPLTFIIR